MARIMCHVSYECLNRSQYVINQMLGHIRTKTQVLCRLAYPLLFLNDSYRVRRIHWILSPFKGGYSVNSTGILGIMKNDDKRVYIIHFLMHSMVRSKYEDPATDDADADTVYKYLLTKRSELNWIRDFLANKIDNNNEPLPQTFPDEVVTAVEEDLRKNFPLPLNAINLKNLYIAASMLLEQASAGTSATWEREENDYLRKIENLQTELQKLKSETTSLKHKTHNMLQYYKQKAPNVDPPDFVDSEDTQSVGAQVPPLRPISQNSVISQSTDFDGTAELIIWN